MRSGDRQKLEEASALLRAASRLLTDVPATEDLNSLLSVALGEARRLALRLPARPPNISEVPVILSGQPPAEPETPD